MKRTIRSLVLAMLVLISIQSYAQIAISVNFGPPALPVYEQPPCPQEGYIWTPGYWAYDDDYGYYWVPGTWVLAPEPGYLWTPGWWGYDGGSYVFHQGYWGPHVGFYGGINYGFGYFGNGFEGGRWDHDRFYYNRAVNNINVTNIHNTYNTTVVNNVTVNRVSYNGGNGGITARPTPEQVAAAQERHLPPIQSQVEHRNTARSMPELRASTNQGKPPIAATERATAFTGNHVMPAKEAGAPYHPPANRNQPQPANEAGRQPARQPETMRPTAPGGSPGMTPNNAAPRPANPAHASELQPHQAPAPVDSGNAQRDQRYQQQQQQLIERQNQQHQQLQMKQQQEHDRATQQNMNAARQQQMEQRHQQQTQQMEQRHTEQMQHMQQRQPQPQPQRPEGGRPH